MTHGIGYPAVDDIDGGNFNNAALQTAGFGIDYAQHGLLLAKNPSVIECVAVANGGILKE